MNPNAVIYLQEYRGQGPATIDYRLWKGPDVQKSFEITKVLTPEEVVAKVLMAARDPDINDIPVSTTITTTSTTSTSTASTAPTSKATTPATPSSSQQQIRAYSTSTKIKEIIQEPLTIDNSNIKLQ